MTPAVLLLIAALAHIAPEAIASHYGGSIRAWEYVATGTEAAALWLAVAALSRHWPVWAVCAYGVFESIQRPICRLMLPMDKAPELKPGQFVCDVAGINTTQLSFAAILMVAAAVAQRTCKS